MQINPYLTMNGNALEALEYYAGILGGKIEGIMKFSEIQDGTEIPADKADRLAHGRIDFDGGSLMISDDWDDTPAEFKGVTLQTAWPTVASAKAAFEKMAADGQVIMPFEPTFWAAGFGMVADKYGVRWMMNCDTESA